HSRINGVDFEPAWSVPGVVEMLHAGRLHGADPNLPVSEYPGSNPSGIGDQTLITLDVARYDGDVIGLVAAETPRAAKAAARAVIVASTPLPVIRNFEEAVADDAYRIHDQLPSNVAFNDQFEWGDVEAGFADAEVVVTS